MTSAMTLASYQRVFAEAIGQSQLRTKTELEPFGLTQSLVSAKD